MVRVARNREPGQTLKQIAADFGISESCLAGWITQPVPIPASRPTTSAEHRRPKGRTRDGVSSSYWHTTVKHLPGQDIVTMTPPLQLSLLAQARLRPSRNNGTVSGATWSFCRSQVRSRPTYSCVRYQVGREPSIGPAQLTCPNTDTDHSDQSVPVLFAPLFLEGREHPAQAAGALPRPDRGLGDRAVAAPLSGSVVRPTHPPGTTAPAGGTGKLPVVHPIAAPGRTVLASRHVTLHEASPPPGGGPCRSRRHQRGQACPRLSVCPSRARRLPAHSWCRPERRWVREPNPGDTSR